MLRFFQTTANIAIKKRTSNSFLRHLSSNGKNVASATATTVAGVVVADAIHITYSALSKHLDQKMQSLPDPKSQSKDSTTVTLSS